ncbi:MAG TPA: glycosyltransferase family 4 protein [Lacipirellulaceae bacterium]|jgi:glycosyltransferase involved in cell wall biosynthesis|nr:glycosyltransferase family 4 protein [Lacipirellulaceae bacterium]
MTLPPVSDSILWPLAGESPVAPIPNDPTRDDANRAGGHAEASAAPKSIFALHLVNGEHYSGAERVQDLLARQLPRFGCEVGFACVKPERFPNTRETKTAPLVEMPMHGRFDLRIVKQLEKLCRNEDYDLIHAHTPRTALVGRLAARRAGVPFIYHVHSPAGRDSTRRILNWINAAAEWAVVRGADRLITVSPSLRDYMIGRGISAERITCVPNGVPGPNFVAERRPPAAAWTLGTVALFRPRKGIEVLLEALAMLRSRNINVRLRAVGGFETSLYKAEILGLAERLDLADAIDWIGFTRNVNRELAKIHLFVLPSLFGEGLPMVVLEAMAAGLPVVASHVEGVPEAILHRETGLLVEPGSVSQLTTSIEEVISGGVSYTDLSHGARQRHAERFSDLKMAEGVADVYRQVLAARAAKKAAAKA